MSGRHRSQMVDPEQPLSSLTERQKQFALFVAEGKPVETARRLAGYKTSHKQLQTELMANPRIQAAVKHLHKRYENAIVMSRKRVMEGFLEAIEQAKMLTDPAVQIAGWREIGKMCGYYAPEVKEINVNVGAKRVVNQLEVLSDTELLQLIEQDKEAIEGEVLLMAEEAQAQDDGSSSSAAA